MDRSKVHTLSECLGAIETMEKVCVDKFNSRICKNLRTYYVHYCYKTFETKPLSSENTIGYKSPLL